jgi:hypothetical protein
MLKRVEDLGRRGDTILAHINPAEAELLRRSGGSGTINPRTGLPEFGGGGGTINGAGGSGNVSGGGRGNTSTGEGRGNNPGKGVDRVNSGLGQQHPSWGNRMETPYGAPYRTTPYGTVALPEDRWNAWKDQVNKYNEAANKWNAGTGRSFANFVNEMAPMGFAMEPPDLNKPKTYVGGDYHLGLNPGNLVGGLLGGAVFPGGGIPGAAIGGAIYDATGLGNVMLGGGAVPAGWDPGGAAGNPIGFGTPGSGSGLQGEAGPMSAARPTEGSGAGVIPGPINSTPPSIMQPKATARAVPPVPIFTPKPLVQSQFTVPGGNPYGFSIFGRAAA